MKTDMSILSLVLNASVLVQAVMLTLVAISLASWTTIFRKGFHIRRTRAETERFETTFLRDREIGALYQQARVPLSSRV